MSSKRLFGDGDPMGVATDVVEQLVRGQRGRLA